MIFSARAFGRLCLNLWAGMVTLGILHDFPTWFQGVAVIALSAGLAGFWVDFDRRASSTAAYQALKDDGSSLTHADADRIAQATTKVMQRDSMAQLGHP